MITFVVRESFVPACACSPRVELGSSLDTLPEVFLFCYPALTWKNDAHILSILGLMELQFILKTSIQTRSHPCNKPSFSETFPKTDRALGSFSRNQLSATEPTLIHRSCLGREIVGIVNELQVVLQMAIPLKKL